MISFDQSVLSCTHLYHVTRYHNGKERPKSVFRPPKKTDCFRVSLWCKVQKLNIYYSSGTRTSITIDFLNNNTSPTTRATDIVISKSVSVRLAFPVYQEIVTLVVFVKKRFTFAVDIVDLKNHWEWW